MSNAIVIDPDNLDRFQVIFGTASQKLSLYPVGLSVVGGTSSDGETTVGTRTFQDSTADFVTDVTVGDILCLLTGLDAGHYIVESIDSATQITVEAYDDFVNFSASETDLVYDIREPEDGSITLGATLQALYSYSKEEWRVDSEEFGGDDLIRHEFPFEAITSEQFEIGGGDAHRDWTWFNEFTRKKVRTGGWADKDITNVDLEQWTGIITLGALDPDTQVYYQQDNVSAAPQNFTFLGPVNEPILIFEDGGADFRTFLKLFARKKGRTYAGSEIADIGVTTIQTIVNRFPLAHALDPAIVATDGAILGSAPWRNQNPTPLESGTDGSVVAEEFTFTSTSADFVSEDVGAGDTLWITTGNQIGRYTISDVVSATVLEIYPDFEFSDGWSQTESSLTYSITTTYKIRDRTDGALADVDGDTGTLTSAAAGFTGVVAPGDLVIITETGDSKGVYRVISVDSDTVLTLDTSDHPFSSESGIDFDVVYPGMYLQYKNEEITLGAYGDLTFTNADPDTIERETGSWITDGVSIGTTINISGSADNDGTYTVAGVTASTLTLVATDQLINEGPVGGVTVTAFDNFKRDIGGNIYSYRWRLTGNGASLANIYQFVQHQLRQTDDIDFGNATFRGDVTDLLMAFSTPTATMFDMYIDNLAGQDINNATFEDTSGVARNFPFLASVELTFNANLRNDPDAKYWLFFANDSAGDDVGRNFGTQDAILVENSDGVPITGNISAQASVAFTYDYDGNVQRGAASAGEDAPVILICIGLQTAQYVIVSGTIARSTVNQIAAVAALERNYSNPS
jgi:hypothetical protein